VGGVVVPELDHGAKVVLAEQSVLLGDLSTGLLDAPREFG
jgi:hypothetical protein